MKTYTMMGPSGPMTTMAKTPAKAKSNFRFRLIHEYGLSWYAAREYDYSDLREI